MSGGHDAEKRGRIRAHVAQEILDSERTYVQGLSALVELYVGPLSQAGELTELDMAAQNSLSMSAEKAGGGFLRSISDISSLKPSSPLSGSSPPGLSAASIILPHSPSSQTNLPTAPDPLSPKIIQALFSNIGTILMLNCKFLNELSKRLDDWRKVDVGKQKLSDIFIQITPFLKMYKQVLCLLASGDVMRVAAVFSSSWACRCQYVNNYDNACQVLNQLLRENYKFKAYVEACESHPRANGLDLSSFLIMPIQRMYVRLHANTACGVIYALHGRHSTVLVRVSVSLLERMVATVPYVLPFAMSLDSPRYKLLLNELLKHTDTDHADHQGLVKALELVTAVATEINDAMKEHDRRQVRFVAVNNVAPCLCS